MTLRLRIVGVVGVVVAAVVLVAGVSLYRTTESSLVGEIDADLTSRAELVTTDRGATRRGVIPFDRLRDFSDSELFSARTRPDPFAALVGFDALARVVDGDGRVRGVLEADFDAPTDAGVLAAAKDDPVLGYGSVADGRVRVVTAALPGEGFVQLARPLDELDAVLRRLLRRTVTIGIAAIVGAGLLAWLLAGRTVRPIRDLTTATEYVAATGDFERGVKTGAKGDEVGRLSASFTSMLNALSASRRQQRQLVMDASHELRTPLTSLRTNVDVLRRGHELSPENHQALVADLDAELGELSDLVAELVDLATDVRDDEDLAPLTLAEVAGPLVEQARRRTGRVIVVDQGPASVLEARPVALGRAIRNLLDNAAKFSAPDTPIRIEISGGRFVVHDQGVGIPVDEREAVFDRFHRVEATRSSPGSGLGLAIVRQVAEAHGGSVFAQQSPDGGAAVGFLLPTVDD